MGALFAYTIYSGVFLLFLFLFYEVLISNEKQIALNRVLLLSCYAVALAAWPISQIDWNSGVSESHPIGEIELLTIAASGIAEQSQSRLPQILIWIYIVGAVAVLLTSLFSIAKIICALRKGKLLRCDGYDLIFMPNNEMAPFSIGRYIVMTVADYEAVSDIIIAHEEAHIRCHHYLDLIIAQIVCVVIWYNPAAWLMRDELKLLHEYQADAVVLESGVDPTSYQMLLIRKTVGNRFNTLVNSLNHSKLKNRIAMMQKEKSGRVCRMRVLALAIAPMVAFGVMNLPAVASDLKSLEDVSLVQASVEVTDEAEIQKEMKNVTGKKQLDEVVMGYGKIKKTVVAPPKEDEGEFYEPVKLNGNLKLYVGPCAVAVHNDALNQAVRVNGKLLTEQIALDTEDIESIETYPPTTEFPGGLIDIRLKGN